MLVPDRGGPSLFLPAVSRTAARRTLGRRFLVTFGCVAAVLFLGACEKTKIVGELDKPAAPLSISTAWQATVTTDEAQARIETLSSALERLREETGTGWVARQDDVTGQVGDLSGGSYLSSASSSPRAAASSMLDAYGPDLFGISSSEINLDAPEVPDPSGGVTLRAEQRVGNVQVLDGALVFAVSPKSDNRVTAIRGRVFPGLNVSTTPAIAKKKASKIAERRSGGSQQGEASLVVVAQGTGVLAWRIPILGATSPEAGGSDGGLVDYLIDAASGNVVDVRASSAEASMVTFGAPVTALGAVQPPPQGKAVVVEGKGPVGQDMQANGLQTSDGRVLLIDTSTPTFDPATGKGAIYTFDAKHKEGDSALPGDIASFPDIKITDGDALGAQVFSRATYNYFREIFNRNSYDDQGSPLSVSVHYGPPDYCNAINYGTGQAYGDPCVRGGKKENATYIQSDVVSHEITHGVTGSTAGLQYEGQSGALNESFSDYFGNIVGQRVQGTDDAMLGEEGCIGISGTTSKCIENPEGRSLRYLLNGSKFSDFLHFMTPPLRLGDLINDNDHGGVHLNSAVWNNALWSIRSNLAKIDGKPGNESPLALQFDQVVYRALTQILGPTSGFVEARAAVEQAARDLNADPVVQRVIGEQMDLNQICDGCVTAPPASDDQIQTGPGVQQLPVTSANEDAWIDFPTDGGYGQVVSAPHGGTPTVQSDPSADALSVGYAGDSLVWFQATDGLSVVRKAPGGSAEVIDTTDGDSAILGLAGSEEGAAWINGQKGTINFVDASGKTTSVQLPQRAQGAYFAAIGTGGGTVAATFEAQGGVGLVEWKVGNEPVVVETGQPIAPMQVDAYGDKVAMFAFDTEGNYTIRLEDFGGGQPTVVSTRGTFFGLTMTKDYVVWVENAGALAGPIGVELDASRGAKNQYANTDLNLYSFGTGTSYSLVGRPGQQGYPDLSGNRLVWQDAGVAGDDVFTTEVPAGL
jgi:Zn-dependent metalloprotease